MACADFGEPAPDRTLRPRNPRTSLSEEELHRADRGRRRARRVVLLRAGGAVCLELQPGGRRLIDPRLGDGTRPRRARRPDRTRRTPEPPLREHRHTALHSGAQQRRRASPRVRGISSAAVGIVVAVASTEGMVAAVLSSVFGAPLAASTIVLLVVITIGVVLAAAHFDPPGDGPAGPGPRPDRNRSQLRS